MDTRLYYSQDKTCRRLPEPSRIPPQSDGCYMQQTCWVYNKSLQPPEISKFVRMFIHLAWNNIVQCQQHVRPQSGNIYILHNSEYGAEFLSLLLLSLLLLNQLNVSKTHYPSLRAITSTALTASKPSRSIMNSYKLIRCQMHNKQNISAWYRLQIQKVSIYGVYSV